MFFNNKNKVKAKWMTKLNFRSVLSVKNFKIKFLLEDIASDTE